MGWDEEKAEAMIVYAKSWAPGQSGNVGTQFQLSTDTKMKHNYTDGRARQQPHRMVE